EDLIPHQTPSGSITTIGTPNFTACSAIRTPTSVLPAPRTPISMLAVVKISGVISGRSSLRTTCLTIERLFERGFHALHGELVSGFRALVKLARRVRDFGPDVGERAP